MLINLQIVIVVYLTSVIGVALGARPTEEERVKLWRQKNTWPPNWQYESPQKKAVMKAREDEIMTQLIGQDERWENWLQFTQSRLVPSFTEFGFEVVQTPPHIHAKLLEAAKFEGDFESLPSEGKIDVIYSPNHMEPKFVKIWEAGYNAMVEMTEMHERWAGGMKLQPTSAYGMRLYQNESSLVMHYDRIETHVISSIVHLMHEYDDDNEPWPIQIEDHDGNMHSVNLEPGQMLHYESAKCLHGRMRKLKGKYYGSLFIHYKPVDRTIWPYSIEDVIASVPPHWRKGTTVERGPRFAGAAITVDSRATASAPPRLLNGKHNIKLNDEL